jgi:hypothetical protein
VLTLCELHPMVVTICHAKATLDETSTTHCAHERSHGRHGHV